MVADQLDGVDLALERALAGGRDAAVLGAEADGGLGRRGARRRAEDPAARGEAPSFERAVQEVHRRRADEAGDEEVGRIVVDLARRVDLLDDALVHDRDAVGQRHRLDLVVGDVDRGDAELGCSRFSSARMWPRSLASRLESGSSIRKTLGRRTMARARATRWRWPPESWRG